MQVKKNKNIALILASLLTTAMLSQNSKDVRGKYCEDLGFGWYCFNIQKGGRYKETSGHSFFKYKSKGIWFWSHDTLFLVSRSRKSEIDTSFYLLKSGTLYSVYFDKKIGQAIRGKPLTKELK